ncbi:MAG: hypothetical protein ACPHCJ_04715, partial [Oceanococcaceae bacterium]
RFALFAVAVLGLSACEQGGRPLDTEMATPRDGATTEPDPDQPAQERPQYPFGLACGWEVASDIDTMNIFYPDESAKYWAALIPMLPNTRLRIDGRYPHNRYFSFNVYDPLLRPSDALADAQIRPNEGGRNPFVDPLAVPGDSYTAYVEFADKPDNPAPNTLYAGAFAVGGQTFQQPVMTGVMYRSYVPAEGLDFDGGVGLPLLTLETVDGEVEILPFPDCVEPLLPNLGGAIGTIAVITKHELLLASGLLPLGDADARTHVFRGLPEFYLTFLAELLDLPQVADGVESGFPDTGGGGFLSNIHNAYTYNIYYRTKGNLILLRAKAPTWRGQPGVAFGSEQLRYWSVCQNDVPTQRYTGCFRDEQAVLDEEGYFTVVVSDAADRPANAGPEQAINWLPWGPYVDAGLVYRHMLPHPDFAQTISQVPRGTAVDDVLGEYAPQTAYCSAEVFATAGDSAKQIFEACRAWTEEHYPTD